MTTFTNTSNERFEKREDALLRLPDSIRSVHSADGGTALDIGTGRMFNLNLVGSKILELLKSGYTESQIVTQISREFGASTEIVQLDVQEFLSSLEKHHLLEQSRLDGTN
jgi:hypothetical protein